MEGTQVEEALRRVEAVERELAAVKGRLALVVETQRVVVRDRSGRALVEIGSSPEGEAELVVLDGRGTDRVLVRLLDDECVLELVDGEGAARLRLAASESSARVVLWCAGTEGRRAEARVGADGTATFCVLDGPAAAPRARLGVTAAGEAVLSVAPAPAQEDRP